MNNLVALSCFTLFTLFYGVLLKIYPVGFIVFELNCLNGAGLNEFTTINRNSAYEQPAVFFGHFVT